MRPSLGKFCFCVVVLVLLGPGCTDGTSGTESPTTPVPFHAAVEKGVEYVLGDAWLPWNTLQEDDILERLKGASVRFGIEPEDALRVALDDLRPLASTAVFLYVYHPEADYETALRRIESESISGRPLLAALLLLHTAPDFSQACEAGLRLLKLGGTAALVGHALLRMATLDLKDPNPDLWTADTSVSIEPTMWLTDIDGPPFRFEDHLIRSLTAARRGGLPVHHDISRLIFCVEQKGGIYDPNDELASKPSFWAVPVDDIAAWLGKMRTPVTFGVARGDVFGWVRGAQATLIGLGRQGR